jgi:hypothetical protein
MEFQATDAYSNLGPTRVENRIQWLSVVEKEEAMYRVKPNNNNNKKKKKKIELWNY